MLAAEDALDDRDLLGAEEIALLPLEAHEHPHREQLRLDPRQLVQHLLQAALQQRQLGGERSRLGPAPHNVSGRWGGEVTLDVGQDSLQPSSAVVTHTRTRARARAPAHTHTHTHTHTERDTHLQPSSGVVADVRSDLCELPLSIAEVLRWVRHRRSLLPRVV